MQHFVALNGLWCADMPLKNYSLTHFDDLEWPSIVNPCVRTKRPNPRFVTQPLVVLRQLTAAADARSVCYSQVSCHWLAVVSNVPNGIRNGDDTMQVWYTKCLSCKYANNSRSKQRKNGWNHSRTHTHNTHKNARLTYVVIADILS